MMSTYLSCLQKSLSNKYFDIDEKSDIPAQTWDCGETTVINNAFPGSIMNQMSVTHNTEYYCCLVEDFMVIQQNTPVVLLIPTQHDCEQWKQLIERCNSLLVSINKQQYHQIMCLVHQTPSRLHAIQGSCKGDRVFHFEEQSLQNDEVYARI